jgi:hypothetical protein
MMFLPKIFRRKPSPAQGRAILEAAIRKTLNSGLHGYIIAEVRDDSEGEVVFSANGDLGEGLGKALELLLENPQTKAMAQSAIFTALKATGKVREVQIVGSDDCDCSLCTARRAKEERQPTTKPH